MRQVILGTYSAKWVPFAFRTATASAPVWALVVSLLGLATAVPSDLGRWLALAIVDAFAGALWLVYWRPLSVVPRWLRDGIRSGAIESAKATLSDWLFFWLFVPLAVVANLAFPAILQSSS